MRFRKDIIILALSILVGWLAASLPASDEVTLSSSLRVTNGPFDLQRAVVAQKFDQAASAGSSYVVQSIQTNAAEIVELAADVTTQGWSFFRCVSTNTLYYVDLGPVDSSTNFLPVVRLYSAELAVLPSHPSRRWYARGGTTGTNAVTGVSLEAWINGR